MERVLSSLLPISQALQSPKMNLMTCYEEVENLTNGFQNGRENAELCYKKIHKVAVQIMDKLDVQAKLPSGVSTDFETYIRTTVYIPFYDYLVSELKGRFLVHQSKCIPNSCSFSVSNFRLFYSSTSC